MAENELHISEACRGSMHLCCLEDLCKCQICHNTCPRCGLSCRNLMQSLDTDEMICVWCRKLESEVWARRGPQCPCCGIYTVVYRDPRSNDPRHLCSLCHEMLGHQYQRHGKWIKDVKVIGDIL